MSNHRRLLAAAGSGSSWTVPLPSTVTLTSAAQGGAVNPWNIAGGYQRGGTAIVAYVDTAGNVECVTYDGAMVGGPYTIHAAFEADAHTGPALLRRSSDGRIVAVYTKHNATPINCRISTNPDDPSAWGSAASLDASLGGTRYTDVQLHELSDGSLFLLYRDEPSAGTDSRWCYSTSTDGGTTWATQTQLFKIASTRSYVITWKDPASDLIHVVTTNGASSGYTKLGHFRIDGITKARTKSDGTSIAAALPLTFTDITTAYSGTGAAFPINLAFGADGYPVIAGYDDMTYIYVRWTGSAWASTSIVSAGTGYEYNGAGTGFQPYGIAVDDGDPRIVWLLRDTGSTPELWRYITLDGGASFTGRQVTSGMGASQQVICVRNPASWLRAFWQVGTWTTYTSWTAGLTGVAS